MDAIDWIALPLNELVTWLALFLFFCVGCIFGAVSR